MKPSICAAAVVVLFASLACAQSDPNLPTFEVASVKPAPPPAGMGIRVTMGGDPGRIDYRNVSLADVLRRAYDVKDYQINGPEWLRTARFDITAKMPPDTPPEKVRLMLQSLLAERFRLQLHRETRELPIYALVVAKNGPKLQPSEVQQEAKGGRMMFSPAGGLECKQVPISGLADMLARQVGRPVVDMTGLNGVFDFKLKYALDEGQRMGMMAGLPPPMHRPDGAAEGKPAPAAESGPSIFAALQEQLGLKLEARKGPVEILIVDRAERVPTDN